MLLSAVVFFDMYSQELIVLHIIVMAETLEVNRIVDVASGMLQPPTCTYNMYSGGAYIPS
jgi:hypothetical protein